MPEPLAELAPPEPDLTPAQMLARAVTMRGRLRELQPDCEELARLPEETHLAFVDAGFCRVLQPRRYGGYEFDLPDFLRIMIEVARGCPESGWVLALTAGHTHTLSFFSRAVQDSVYGEAGDAFVPFVGNLGGSAKEEAGGFRVRGGWDYASGCDIATHILCAAVHVDAATGVPDMSLVLLFPSEFTIVDNWDPLGMRGTGSKRIEVDAHIPTDRVVHGFRARGPGGHPNPLYSGRVLSLLMSEIAAAAVGIGRAAIDEYEEILRVKRIGVRPFSLRYEHHEYQRHIGEAWSLVDTAEAALLDAGRRYMEWSRAHVDNADVFSDERDTRLLLIEQQCVRLAADAVDLLCRTAGSSAMKRGQRLERYLRDMTELRTHGGLQFDRTAELLGRLRFGLPGIPPSTPPS